MSWSLLGVWVSYAIQLGTTMVLARLLTPGEFGLMAMALTFTVIANQFRSLGLSHATVQSQNLTWSQVNALFWINAGVGVLLGVLVAASGFALAAFYGESGLVRVCLALGGAYLFSGLAVQHEALLNRRLQFRTIALRNTLAGLLSCTAAVIAAFAGMGVWALVIQNVAAVIFGAAVLWIAVPWRPTWPGGFRQSFGLIRFGANVTIGNLFTTLTRQGDNVIVGRFLGAGPLGLYSKAYSLLTLPLNQLKTPISGVMVPTLSALQDEPERFRSTYCSTVSGLAHLGMPFVVLLAASAVELIDVFLGPQWGGAAHVFQILAAASFVQLVSGTSGWLYISSGRSAAFARWALASSVIIVAGFLLGVRWGIEGVAASYAICQVVLFVPAFLFATRGTAVRLLDPVVTMLRPVAISVMVLAVAFSVRQLCEGMASLPRLVLTVAAGLAMWMLVLLLWRRARREVTDLLEVVRRRKRGQVVRNNG